MHNPLDYNQAMNDADAIKTRLIKYLLPVVVSALIFNIPKFFESTVVYVTKEVRQTIIRNFARVKAKGTGIFLGKK